ncbi:hypothetical protein D7V97_39235 [Corallococcus sp. CA053C]|uniref:hypothetical protein n=1 Tax=Corallococcus sp. CA053C TaxID=2316732 RepID=UPI000EA18590|nr:hypothetical protein [Corallococcus sp. CA053C]RKG94257.1 hypothetical protein D7V97_39235 [Corallococcus sp. CA053C]
MKLLGRDIPTGALVARIEERLRARGLPTSEPAEVPVDGVEPRVDPLTFSLHALEENADTSRALPLHTHRGGAGQVVLLAKWAFRKSCQVLINETLGRQRVFNGLVRDSYAQLSAEVLRLRREVDTLRAQAARPSKPPDIAYGRPSMPARDERGGSSKSPTSEDEGRARPSKPLPDIAYGRPAKPSNAGPSADGGQPRPAAKPSRADQGPSATPASGPSPKASAPNQVQPGSSPPGRPPQPAKSSSRPSRQGRAQGRQDKAATASGQRTAKPAHPRKAAPAKPPRSEGGPGTTDQSGPSAPTARRSRAKRGGPKKP